MEVKLKEIKGVGEKLYHKFKDNHVWSTYDLILSTPIKYEDFIIKNLSEVKHLDKVSLIVNITSKPFLKKTARIDLVTCNAKIDEEVIKLIFFNRSYVLNLIDIGQDILIKGQYDVYKKQFVVSQIEKKQLDNQIKPIYRLGNIYDKTVHQIVKTIFELDQVQIYETLPKHIIEKYRFISRKESLYLLHQPKTHEDIYIAKRRMKYEEAFFLQLKLITKDLKVKQRNPKPYDITRAKKLIETIPYTLTNDQKQAVNDIYKDFKKSETAYRLILGDVGSGKTMVAALAIYAVITAGQQVAFMAPTELLAEQHFKFFSSFLHEVKVELLTGKTKDKQNIKQDVKEGKINLIIGTHALIEKDLIFNALGFVVIDEQHKFGIDTRNALIEKAMEQDVLYLSATPIPRSLAMLMFSNAHVSLIKEKPVSRKPILTSYITKHEMHKVFSEISSTIKRSEHIYIVVPAITSDKVDDNILSVEHDIKNHFECPIFVLHGKLKDVEKNEVMENFISTKGSILIATTMIEVGIDVPTATLMVIYSAEHFGLSQLHQLRGRVGRSHLKSQCFLISQKTDIDRLKMLEQSQDGFELSLFDLKERGPGDFISSEQSGFFDFKYLDLSTDEKIMVTAHDDVVKLVKSQDFLSSDKYKHLRQFMQAQLKI